MKFEEALKKGKVVIVAGAGISKEPPANLPSWWDYNICLLECIGQMGANALGNSNNLLDIDKIKETVPIVTISEFFENRIAGKSYYPLLSMLDGAEPNINHLMLAKLAKAGVLKSIITTNFDTLLEKAFVIEKVPCFSFSSPDDYNKHTLAQEFPIYKIHGSSDRAEYAIDTVHQKLAGLSVEKREIFKKMFAENHIVFMGFSGEDYLFGTDYIPVRENKRHGYGITWLAYPGSTFNKNTKNLIDELNINVIETTLTDYYKKQGWVLPEVQKSINEDKTTFVERAKAEITNLLSKPYIGKFACVGMCIELLDTVGDEKRADQVVSEVNSIFQRKPSIDILEGLQRVSLYSNLAEYYIRRNNPAKALAYSTIQLDIFKLEDKIIENLKAAQQTNESYRERMLNRATVCIRIGRVLLQFLEHYDEAYEIFKQAFYLSYNARSFENMASALCNISCTDFMIWKNTPTDTIQIPRQPHFIAVMESARRIAEYGGYAQSLLEINCLLVHMYTIFGQRSLAADALRRAEDICELGINRQKNNSILEVAKKIVQMCEDSTPWPKGHMDLCMPYDISNLWDPYGQRPVLTCEEGIFAKKMFEAGKREESVQYLINSSQRCINQEKFDTAEMLADCAAGIFMEASNNAGWENDETRQKRNLENGKKCYETCLELQFKMGRLDYLVGTLSSLSKINFILNELDIACFQAELALCICNDPNECWQVVLAAETACKVNYMKGNKANAKKFCKEYFRMVEKAPWSTDPSNIEKMKKLLIKLEKG